MSERARFIASLIAGLLILLLLIGLAIASPPTLNTLIPALLFGVLIVFTTTFGVPLAGGRGSLLPMITVAAYLVLGAVPAAWIAFGGAVVHVCLRYRWAEQLGERLEPGHLRAVGLAAANASIQAISILGGGLVYQWAGGSTPLTGVSWADLPWLLLLALTYLGLNLLTAGFYMASRGLKVLRFYVRSLPNLISYEAWPMVFAPLMALTYTRLGIVQFALLSLAIIVASLIARNLALARQRLERRVKELHSLQAVGQALSASLDLDTILEAIHKQVAALMPARNFYVALYDGETDEVSFPLAIEEGRQVHWRSRRTGGGLTEYILRNRGPLLIQEAYDATLEALGIEKIGRPAASWLGVPILAGEEPLGVIAVQSYSPAQNYDASHQEVLITIAAQAAVAIQNARLYARTDQALASRVQELDSILRTTQEGILLFDADYCVLAANRALAGMLGVAQLELAGQELLAPRPEGEPSLAFLIGYRVGDLEVDCQALAQGERGFLRKEIVIPGPAERRAERTLTAVHSREGAITGWLLVFRDVTEERELDEFRGDLTGMLIHDLRSPLTVVMSSLELMSAELSADSPGAFEELVDLAKNSTHRLLRLINDLLDISRLESGRITVHPQALDVGDLLQTIVTRLGPLATEAGIRIEIATEADLPWIYADPEFIDRALHNLVDNALKFTPDGGQVRLWARLDDGQEPATVLLGVTDTGPGIPPEAQSRLFKKFQQVVSSTGRRVGTGLGLPFSKLAVEAHGGEIWAESEPGKGSTFVVRLPVAENNVEEEPAFEDEGLSDRP